MNPSAILKFTVSTVSFQDTRIQTNIIVGSVVAENDAEVVAACCRDRGDYLPKLRFQSGCNNVQSTNSGLFYSGVDAAIPKLKFLHVVFVNPTESKMSINSLPSGNLCTESFRY